jgi:sulfur-carrier protein adenylyltransferase/sulfurtransferase
MLSETERLQYSRQLFLPDFGEETQMKLKSARVLIAGVGGLGSPAALYLAAAGIGHLGLADADVVEISNLQRQILYSHHSLGEKKTNIAQQELRKRNPFIEIKPHEIVISQNNINDLLDDYDIVLGALDNAQTRYLLNDSCIKKGKVYVHGAISQFEGQVSVFNYKGKYSYRDIFPEPPPNDFSRTLDKAVFPPLPGIVGTLMASEVLKIVTGQGTIFSGKLLLINLKYNQFNTIGFWTKN